MGTTSRSTCSWNTASIFISPRYQKNEGGVGCKNQRRFFYDWPLRCQGSSSTLVQAVHEAPDSLNPLLQLLHRSRIRNAQIAFSAKARTVCDHGLFLLQQAQRK